MSAIIEEKYTKAAVEAARISEHRKSAITNMIATAKKLPQILSLAENTTPSKLTPASYPHMIYMGGEIRQGTKRSSWRNAYARFTPCSN
jgi:hypothetical protein